MNLYRMGRMSVAMVGLILFTPFENRAFGNDAEEAYKADRKLIEKTDAKIHEAGRHLEEAALSQKRAGEKIEQEGQKDGSAAYKDNPRLSKLNDKVARLRGEADYQESKGRRERAAALRSEANDVENRGRSLSNDMQAKEEAAWQRRERGRDLQRKADELIEEAQNLQRL